MEISSLTLEDFVLIQANWLTLTDEQFQCEKYFDILSLRKDAETVTNYERKIRGCGVFLNEPKVEIEGIGYHSCLCHKDYKHPNMDSLLFLHDNYKKGILPYKGSLTEQPAQIIEVFQLIDRLYSDRQQKTNSEK